MKWQLKNELNTLLYFTFCFFINFLVIRWNIHINLILYILNILFFLGIYKKYKYINALKAIFIILMLIMGHYAISTDISLSFISVLITWIALSLMMIIYNKWKIQINKKLMIFVSLYVVLLVLLFVYRNPIFYLLTLLSSSFNCLVILDIMSANDSHLSYNSKEMPN